MKTMPEPDSPEMVETDDGDRVPRRFRIALPSYPDAAGVADLVIEVVDGVPKFADVRLTPPPDEPLDPADVAGIDWARLMHVAVTHKAMECSGYRFGDDAWRDGLMALAAAREFNVRRNAVTRADLERLVALVDEVGIDGAMKETGKSRGYVYKLLRRARRELP
jgi:hypothetical protein